jgi:hypothetical protein
MEWKYLTLAQRVEVALDWFGATQVQRKKAARALAIMGDRPNEAWLPHDVREFLRRAELLVGEG